MALGDFVDLECPFTLGHSRAVAELPPTRPSTAGLDAMRDADPPGGCVHDLGRIGVSNQIWSKSGGLTMAEFERMRLHPYLTERILSQVPGMKDVATVAANHHECLDGSGIRADWRPAVDDARPAVGVAVSYQSALEPRPYGEAWGCGCGATAA